MRAASRLALAAACCLCAACLLAAAIIVATAIRSHPGLSSTSDGALGECSDAGVVERRGAEAP